MSPNEHPHDKYLVQRERMVADQIQARGVRDPLVLAAMRAVPRHRFVPAHLIDSAYNDSPLPIGQGQTISQPYIVALMTELLELRGGESVLEVGAGSGYQAAVLSQIVGQVWTVERLPDLARQAGQTLEAVGCANVCVQVGDGSAGWPEKAPFDAIIVTAAAPQIPQPLQEQLADGGRLVAPVGPRWTQELVRVRRRGDRFFSEEILHVAFVPLLGAHGWQERGESHWS